MSGAKARVAGLVLAAGKGTRMKSPIPKVLHQIAGKAILDWVIGCLREAGYRDMCVVINDDIAANADFRAAYGDLTLCAQRGQRGTGDAVASAAHGIRGARVATYTQGALIQGSPVDCTHVLICAGDVPGMRSSVLRDFVDECLATGSPLGVLGMDVPEPKGYGRLVMETRGSGDDARRVLVKIVEEKDADEATRRLTVCNSGVVFAEARLLFELLADLTPANAQNEYYLTDIFALGRERGHSAHVYTAPDWTAFLGINDQDQLKAIERTMLARR